MYYLGTAEHDNFFCTGDRCVDNCCHTWRINIDEETIERCKQLGTKKEYAAFAAREVYLPNKEKFKAINLNANGDCVHLDSNRLCKIYKKLGPEYMGKVCQTYPRFSHVYNGITELCLALSCPAVCELLLLNPNGINFSVVPGVVVEQPVGYANTIPVDLGFDIRTAVISMFQNRALSLTERIIYCSIFVSRLEGILEEKPYDDLPKLRSRIEACIEKFKAYLTNVDIFTALIKSADKYETLMKNVYHISLNNIKSIIEVLPENTGANNHDFYQELKQLREEMNEKLSAEKILEIKQRVLDPYLASKSYVFENLMVINLFNTLYPMSKSSVNYGFKELIYIYHFIQAFIALVCRNKEVTDRDVVNCIYYFNRKIKSFSLLHESLINSI